MLLGFNVFFFQAEDGIRDADVTGVQTCALPISARPVICRAVEVTLATRRVSEAVLMMAWPVTSRAVFAPASEPGSDRAVGAATAPLPEPSSAEALMPDEL